jgi:hypothetical protein
MKSGAGAKPRGALDDEASEFCAHAAIVGAADKHAAIIDNKIVRRFIAIPCLTNR